MAMAAIRRNTVTSIEGGDETACKGRLVLFGISYIYISIYPIALGKLFFYYGISPPYAV